MNETSHIVEIEGLSVDWGKQKILDDVHFSVSKGQFAVIIGPNGAGKTTLLKCLMRICGGFKGRIRLGGRPLDTYNQRALARYMSYVPQMNTPGFGFTVREFVGLGRYPHLGMFAGFSAADQRAIDQALEMTNTRILVGRRLSSLSGGERQRVSIAAAMAQDAEVVLLDEPTTYLDPRHQGVVLGLMEKLNRELGKTILCVTHDINLAAMWGDPILALRDGQRIFAGSGEQLMNNNVLESIFAKRFVFSTHPTTGMRLVVPDGRAA